MSAEDRRGLRLMASIIVLVGLVASALFATGVVHTDPATDSTILAPAAVVLGVVALVALRPRPARIAA